MSMRQIFTNRPDLGSLDNASISANAGIETSKLAEGNEFLQSDGTVSLQTNWDMGAYSICAERVFVSATGSFASDELVPKSYVDSISGAGSSDSYATTAQFGSHTADTSIHFSKTSLGDLSVTSGLGTHTGDSTIHFTEASIDLHNISNTGHDHAQYALSSILASHTADTNAHYSLSAGNNIGITFSGTTATISGSGGSGTGELNTASNLVADADKVKGLYAQKNVYDLEFKSLSAGTGISLSSASDVVTIYSSASGTVDASNLVTTAQFDSHTGDSTIHYTKSSLGDLSVTSGLGTHTGDATIHFTVASLELNKYALSSSLESHTGDTTIHYTKSSLGDLSVTSGLGTHTGDATIHYTKESLGDLSVTSGLGTHTGDTTIHYTKASLGDLSVTSGLGSHTGDASIHYALSAGTNISLSGTGTDTVTIYAHDTTLDANNYTTTSQFQSHTGDATIHYTKASLGDLSVTSGLGTHTGDSSIHFTKESLNLPQYALSSSLGSHTGDSTIHFTKTSLGDLSVTSGLGTHTGDSTIHYTKDSLGDLSVTSGLGTHTGDASIHFTESSIQYKNISGTAHDHALSEISDYVDSNYIHADSSNESKAGNLTANRFYVSTSTPLASNELASKAYVDSISAGSASAGGSGTPGYITRWATDSEITDSIIEQIGVDGVDVKGTLTSDRFYSDNSTPILSKELASKGYVDTLTGQLSVSSHTHNEYALTASLDSHTGDTTIHFTKASLGDLSVTSGLGTHTGDTTIHFTESSIDHTTIQNIGTLSHSQLDSKIDVMESHTGDATIHYAQGSINLGNLGNVDQSATADGYVLTWNNGSSTWVAQENTSPNVDGYVTTGQFGSHTGDATIHFTKGSLGDLSVTSGLGTHTGDSTIHFTESSIDHTAIQNIGTLSHTQLDSKVDVMESHTADSTIHFTKVSLGDLSVTSGLGTHTGDSTIHYTKASLGDLSVTSGLGTHTGDSTIHFTESSIDHANIQNVGTYTHDQIDSKIDVLDSHTANANIHYALSAGLNISLSGVGSDTVTIHAHDTTLDANNYTTTAQFQSHTGDSTIHYTESSIDHTAIQNIGTLSHNQLDSKIDVMESHTGDSTIHFTKESLGDLSVTSGLGTHTGDSTIHFTESSIDHTNIQNIGTLSHSQLDSKIDVMESHTGDSTIHFTESSIDHTAISNIGTNSHSVIDGKITDFESHTGNNTIHTTSNGDTNRFAFFDGTNSITGYASLTSDALRTTIKTVNMEIGLNNIMQTSHPSIAIGQGNTTNTSRSWGIAIGQGNQINSTYGVVVGYGNVGANNTNYIFGKGNRTNVADSFAFGQYGQVNHSNSIIMSTYYAYSISSYAIHFMSRTGGVHFLSGTRIYLTEDAVTPTADTEVITKGWADSIFATTNQFGTHTGDTTIHYTKASLGDLSVTSGLGTHTGDSTIHYTQGSINLGNIGNVNQSATADGYVLTWNNGTSTWVAQENTSPNVDGYVTTGQFGSHTADSTIHYTESSIDHTAIQNIGTLTHSQLDSKVDVMESHTANASIHFTKSSLGDLSVTSGLGTHTGDTAIHYTQGSINLGNLGNVDQSATADGYVLTWNNGSSSWVAQENTSPNVNAYVTTAQYESHTGDATIHYTRASLGDLSVTSGLGTHTGDSTIHFTESSIDHTAIQNVGTLTHSQLDSKIDVMESHTADSNIHFTKASLGDLSVTAGLGTHTGDSTIHYTKASLGDLSVTAGLGTHTGDTTIHFTESSIDHTNITNVGTLSHSQLDSKIDVMESHTGDATIHYTQGSINLGNLGNVDQSLTADNRILVFKTATNNWVVQDNTGGSGEANTLSAVADSNTNKSITATKVGDVLVTKSLSAGNNISLSADDRYVTIHSSGSVQSDSYTTTAQFGSHTGDSTIHFTESSIDHTAIQNIGTLSHSELDGKIDVMESHTADSTIHFTEGSIDHTAISNIGTNSHAVIDGKITDLESHTGDSTIHYTESSIDHTNIQNVGVLTHSQLDSKIDVMESHTADSTIHFTKTSLGDLSVTSGLGTHTGDSTIHYTQSSINLGNLGNVNQSATADGYVLTWNNGTSTWVAQENTSPNVDGYVTTGQFGSHTGDSAIHFTKTSLGDLSVTSGLGTHTGDSTIHFTESSIDHTNITNIGTLSHSQLDSKVDVMESHTADSTIHFTEGSIDHTAISNIGTNSHAVIDGKITDLESHTGDSTIHFTKDSLGDLSVTSGLGTHTGDSTIHYTQSAINLGNIGNVDQSLTADGYVLTWDNGSSTWIAQENTSPNVDGYVTTGQFGSHTGDSTIHFTENSIDHTAIQNIGTLSHSQLDSKIDVMESHTADSTIHFTEGSIDHTAISNIGANSHAVIDGKITDLESHTGDSTIHFSYASLGDLSVTSGLGTHTGDSTIHFTESSIDHANIQNVGSHTHSDIDNKITDFESHTGDSTIHFTRTSLGDLSVTSGLGTHTGDTTIHYTQASINLGNLGNIDQSATADGYVLTWDNGTSTWVAQENTSPNVDGYVTTGQFGSHTGDSTIHFTESSIDHTAIQNVGTLTHSQLDRKVDVMESHTADSTIHFTEGSIDHTAISNIGTNSHAVIDGKITDLESHTGDSTIHFTYGSLGDLSVTSGLGTHTGDSTIHFAESSIDHTAIQNIGTLSHSQLDSKINVMESHTADSTIHFTYASLGDLSVTAGLGTHTGDSTIHFTESSIDHTAIQNVGTLTHAQLDSKVDVMESHTGDSSIHFTKASLGDLSVTAGLGTHTGDTTIHYTKASLGDLSVTSGLGTHTGDSTIHFTESSIDHTNITNVGTLTHAQLDSKINVMESHTGDSTIHYTRASLGDLSVTAGLGTHTGDATIHFTESSIDHTNIQNVGSHTHSVIDGKIADFESHTGDSTIHFSYASLGDLSVTSGLGTHTGDSTIHYTIGSVNLGNIGNVNQSATADNYVLTWNNASSTWIAQEAPGSSGGENNTLSAVADTNTNKSITATKVGAVLVTKSLSAGNNISLSADDRYVTIHSSGGGGDITGVGDTNYLAVWTGTNSITGYSNVQYDGGSLSADRFYGSTTAHVYDNELITKEYLDYQIQFIGNKSGFAWEDELLQDTFIVYDSIGNPISGLTLTSTVYYNGATSDTAVTITEIKDGAYKLEFTPTQQGHWMIESHAGTTIDLNSYYFVVNGLSGTSWDTSHYATTGQIESHTADTTIHYTQDSINLGNIGNVNQSATSDGYVLTWDNGSSTWTAQESAGGAIVLSDLNDVDTSGSGANEFLGWDGTYWSSMLISGTTHDHDTSALTSGTLGIARGGTNQTTYTNNHLLSYNGTSIFSTDYKFDSYALTGQFGTHTGDSTIHYTRESLGDLSVTSGLGTHTGDATIHYAQSDINLGNVGNVDQSATADGYVLTWENSSNTWTSQGIIQEKAITIESPSNSESIPMFWTSRGIQIISVFSAVSGGAGSTVTYNIVYGSSLTSGTNVTTTPSALGVGAGGTQAVINNGNVSASSWVRLITTATAGTPSWITTTVTYI